MELNDYYSILELPPSATPEEIKQAYRRMAKAYHPDKRADDPYAAAQFAIVKEAYETLTDPAKKNQYLQDRWYAKSTGKLKTKLVLNPVNFLKQVIELERSVARMDSSRIDQSLFLSQLMNNFSDDAVDMLNKFGDQEISKQVIQFGVRTSRWLSHTSQQTFYRQLGKIRLNEGPSPELEKNLRDSRNRERWESLKVWIILIIVIAICFSIYLAG